MGLPRRARLTRKKEFERVAREGRRGSGGLVALNALVGADSGGPPRWGLVVSKKIGGAAARNRAKRVLREAARLLSEKVPAGTHVVVVARPGVEAASLAEVLAGMEEALRAAGVAVRGE